MKNGPDREEVSTLSLGNLSQLVYGPRVIYIRLRGVTVGHFGHHTGTEPTDGTGT